MKLVIAYLLWVIATGNDVNNWTMVGLFIFSFVLYIMCEALQKLLLRDRIAKYKDKDIPVRFCVNIKDII